MQAKQLALPAIVLVLVALMITGCTSPTSTPRPTTIDTPQDAVIQYWQAIDRGDYDTAYDLTHQTQNISRKQWIDQHLAAWGENGTYIQMYNFTVIGNTSLDLDTFPGNFTSIDSVVVQTNVSYCGKNTTGISQFAAVKEADDGWKFYGSY
jgi:outer membrane biogenesis lipoprotein LolB